MQVVLELKNVSKVIKGKKIIDGISFTVNEGEVFGFLGPNGAGKTTTIRMIVGLMEISEGDILICDTSVKSNFEKAVRNIGAIVENPEMYKFLSGYENLLHYARMMDGITKERISEVVELVGLTDRIKDKVKTYSLGMRQRLGLAQCLLHNPKLLILDEPTNGLDPAGIREIRDYLRKLAGETGMAVIVSSHMLSEMEMMCDRIAIIQAGKIIDVQNVRDFVKGENKKYLFEVNYPQEVLNYISGFSANLTEEGVLVELNREQVPDVVEILVKNGILIYGIREVAKSLEDRFLEVTERKEEVTLHA
ncbi:ABC transporter ATP-binding protein [Peribacillus alkalitolerans]|uniref:ABC transporter ATP-binding protein n=1 Tax=Peribacillus alkalitolerans TaxID=1550385 RepID=UPI0013D814EE|nr:ABC transporter ATP-binding protein [Peribacillus alkalitolerans]